MLLNVIISISRKGNFMMLLNEQPIILSQHQKIRRLSWHEGSSGLGPNTDLSHLRSFTAFSQNALPKDYRKQRLLRAIDLEGSRDFFRRQLYPRGFSKLFLLKYLSLRNTELYELPDSIGDLQNLEFLDIRGNYITKLPNTIVKLQKLVYLLVHALDLKVPKGIRKLKRLTALGMTRVDNVQLLQEIGELVELEKLDISLGEDDLGSRMLEEISGLLSKLNGSLRSLTIFHFVSVNQLKKALDGVASPPLLLCKFHIYAKLGGLPAWFASLKQVVKITLHDTELQLQDLQVLRNLHTLVKLVLGPGSFDNPNKRDLVFDQGGFTHLKFLEIQSQSVSFEEGALQSLEILKIFYWGEYSVNGIEHLHGLKEVHVQTWSANLIDMVKDIAANHSNRPKCFATLI